MSLSRIFSPGQSMKLTPESNATGWVNALNGGGVYYFGSGVVRITVTAKNVDGVKILDWDKDQYRSPEVAANDNKHATITAVFDLGSSGRVVTRFLNPQANAEGIMSVETAPPPRVLAGFTAFLRRWRHGAKTRHENFHRQRTRLGSPQKRRGNNTRTQRPHHAHSTAQRVPTEHQYPNGDHRDWGPVGPRHHQREQRRRDSFHRRELLWHSHLPQPLATVGGGA